MFQELARNVVLADKPRCYYIGYLSVLQMALMHASLQHSNASNMFVGYSDNEEEGVRPENDDAMEEEREHAIFFRKFSEKETQAMVRSFALLYVQPNEAHREN